MFQDLINKMERLKEKTDYCAFSNQMNDLNLNCTIAGM